MHFSAQPQALQAGTLFLLKQTTAFIHEMDDSGCNTSTAMNCACRKGFPAPDPHRACVVVPYMMWTRRSRVTPVCLAQVR